MTKREKQAVYRAAEMIETGKEPFSCWALDSAGCDVGLTCFELVDRYCEFYDKQRGAYWLGKRRGRPDTTAHRVMLLLLFAETGGVL